MRQATFRAQCARLGCVLLLSLTGCDVADEPRRIDGIVRFADSGKAVEGATVDLLAVRGMGMPMSHAEYVVIATTRTRPDGSYAFDVDIDRLALVELQGAPCRWSESRKPLRFADLHATVMLEAQPSPCVVTKR